MIGSLCLSDIPKDLIKEVQCKDGVKRAYINIAVAKRKETSQTGETHFMTCGTKENKVFIGGLKEWMPAVPSVPTPEQIDAAPSWSEGLPF